MVLYGPFVDFPVVLHGSQFSVFLFDEKEWCCVRAFRGADVTLFQVFPEELLERLLFRLGKGVYLSWERSWGILFQVDGMIPLTCFGKSVSLLFAEDLCVSAVLLW